MELNETVEFACSCLSASHPSAHCEAGHPRFSEWRGEVQAEYERTGLVPKTPAYPNQSDDELSQEQEYILRRIAGLVPLIRNNGHLRRILRKIAGAERQEFYDLVKPHLSFKPLPYSLIKF